MDGGAAAALEGVLKPVLDKLESEVAGVTGVVVSSTDSVCFGQRWKEEETSLSVVTFFPFVAEQISKLRWGTLQSVVADYENGARLVHVNVAPLVFTFVGTTAGLDTDALTSSDMYHRLEKGFEPLRKFLLRA